MTDRASTLQPTRPLVWIGVETTGTGPAMSRIAKIAILRIEPTGVTTNYIRRLNPGKVADLTSLSLRPIPAWQREVSHVCRCPEPHLRAAQGL